MGEKILLIAVLLLALYGFAELLCHIAARLLGPGRECGGVWVIPVSGHREDIEVLVREAAARRLRGRPYPVLLLDTGMDEETRRLAERVCAQVGTVDICSCPDGLQKDE